MNKSEMVGRVADRAGISRSDANVAVDAVFGTIGESLAAGEDVSILGFGTFTTRNRPARTGRNPRTGEEVAIAASTAPAFKAGKTLKDIVNRG